MTRNPSHTPNPENRSRSRATKAALAAAAMISAAPLAATAQDAVSYSAEKGLVILFSHFETTLSYDEMIERTRAQMPQLRATEGLVQTYYVKLDEPNRYGAIHVWENAAALTAFREGEIATGLGSYFELAGPPTIMVVPSVFQLRDTIVQD